jgi:hypothetical protein
MEPVYHIDASSSDYRFLLALARKLSLPSRRRIAVANVTQHRRAADQGNIIVKEKYNYVLTERRVWRPIGANRTRAEPTKSETLCETLKWGPNSLENLNYLIMCLYIIISYIA